VWVESECLFRDERHHECGRKTPLHLLGWVIWVCAAIGSNGMFSLLSADAAHLVCRLFFEAWQRQHEFVPFDLLHSEIGGESVSGGSA